MELRMGWTVRLNCHRRVCALFMLPEKWDEKTVKLTQLVWNTDADDTVELFQQSTLQSTAPSFVVENTPFTSYCTTWQQRKIIQEESVEKTLAKIQPKERSTTTAW